MCPRFIRLVVKQFSLRFSHFCPSLCLMLQSLSSFLAGIRSWDVDLNCCDLAQQLQLFITRHSANFSSEVKGQYSMVLLSWINILLVEDADGYLCFTCDKKWWVTNDEWNINISECIYSVTSTTFIMEILILILWHETRYYVCVCPKSWFTLYSISRVHELLCIWVKWTMNNESLYLCGSSVFVSSTLAVH